MDNFRRRIEKESTPTIVSRELYFTSITVQSNNLQSQSGIVQKGTDSNTWFCPVVGAVEVIAEYDIVNKLSNGNEVVVKHGQQNIILKVRNNAKIVKTNGDNDVLITNARIQATSSGHFYDLDYELSGSIYFYMIDHSGGSLQTSVVHFDAPDTSGNNPDVIQWDLTFHAGYNNRYTVDDLGYYNQISGIVGSCTLTRLSNTQIKFDFNPV